MFVTVGRRFDEAFSAEILVYLLPCSCVDLSGTGSLKPPAFPFCWLIEVLLERLVDQHCYNCECIPIYRFKNLIQAFLKFFTLLLKIPSP